MGIKQRTLLCLVVVALFAVYLYNAQYVQPASACYGPHITGDVDRTEVNLNETITVSGQVCPVGDNKTIRIAFTRPDYTFIEQYCLTDPQTGNFTTTQQLDMAGYWNIFVIDGHICDRLFAQVTDPAHPDATPVPLAVELNYKPNYLVIGVSATLLSIGAVITYFGTRNQTRKITAIRTMVQIGFVFLIFFGIFIDHFNMPVPAEQIAPHEVLIADNVLGVGMPDGLPVPFFACYYPCGKTVTCALWELQTYIYPFFNAGGGWGVHYDASGLARLAVVFGSLILGAVVLGRIFCGWVCPFGLYMDLITRLRKAFKIRKRQLSDKSSERLHQLGYVVLAVIILLCVLFASQTLFGTELVAGTEKGGFVYTYYSAPFCQVCPMKPLCMLAETSVGLLRPEWLVEGTTGQFLQLGFYLTSLNLVILAIVSLAAFFFRRSWCQICPLGALIALFNRFPPFKWISGVRLHKVEEKCTKCGICKRVCPTQVVDVYEKKGGDVANSQCIYCLRCVEMCPHADCLQLKLAGKTVAKSRNWLNKSDTIRLE
ncbi:MAG: 4Fe-4S binding protein [Candidatus Bathyarchaeota archaeon]|nr:4Fe-4S binding protein [Candidatus Bathyarchaeota archaeon]